MPEPFTPDVLGVLKRGDVLVLTSKGPLTEEQARQLAEGWKLHTERFGVGCVVIDGTQFDVMVRVEPPAYST